MPCRCALDFVTTVSSLRGAAARNVERKSHDPFDAAPGEDRGLGRNLFRQAAMCAAAVAGVFALAVLAHDHPVEVAGTYVAQRRGYAWQDARRAHIGVLVKALADRQPQAPQRDVVGDVGIADRAEIDRVRGAQPGERVRGHELPCLRYQLEPQS